MMKKQLTALFLALLFTLAFLAIPVSADELIEYVHSDYGDFMASETDPLTAVAKEIYDTDGVEIFFVIAADVPDGEAAAYARQYYEDHAAGGDGMILLLTDTEWGFYCVGRADELLDEDKVNGLWDVYNKADTYYEGVENYLNAARKIIEGEDPHLIEGWEAACFMDKADLLSEDDEAALNSKLEEISDRNFCDVIIATVNSFTGDNIQAFADDVYDTLDFGFDEGRDGLIFVLSMEERDWAISTSGRAIGYFTDAGQDYIFRQIRSSLSENDYVTAFNDYAELCDDFIRQGKTGEPYDEGTLPDQKKTFDPFLIVISLGFGAVLAFIPAGALKSKMKTVHKQGAAASYVRSGSLNMVAANEQFLYSKVSTHPRNTGSSGGRTGGGSTTHVSSSGATHGGSSGKF